MSIFLREKKNNKEESSNTSEKKENFDFQPVLVASIVNIVTSEIFQDILKENNIPFICRQRGANGSVKILFGGGIVPDEIYVNITNYDKAKELFEAYLKTEVNTEEDTDSQE